MSTSVVDICNSALNQLGATNILTLTDDSKVARIVNQRFPSVRDAVMRSHPWNCLISRATLAPDLNAPAFEFGNAFTLPTDPYCLRVLSIGRLDLPYRLEGRKILSSESNIQLTYIGRVLDVNLWDSLFSETLVSALAADICYPIVGSNTLQQTFRALYDEKIREARFVDATEGTPASIDSVSDYGAVESDLFIRSRF